VRRVQGYRMEETDSDGRTIEIEWGGGGGGGKVERVMERERERAMET